MPTLALAVGAIVVAWQAGSWIADLCSPASGSVVADQTAVFDQRFPQDLSNSNPRPFVRALRSELEVKLQAAKTVLAQKLLAEITPAPPSEDKQAVAALSVPLPRPRPNEAVAALPSNEPAQTDDRTVLQKLADLVRPLRLASLTPGDGLFSSGPDLTALGYDKLTAVYDISARTVYMPNGSKLEAHSGYGDLKDDPRHVDERMVGATPPAIYELKLREKDFHGVQAIRMIPMDGSSTLGRSGLLVHNYMLGPAGDSNGCVSIKEYERFLNAFQSGEIKHLLVVTSLPDLVQQPPLKS